MRKGAAKMAPREIWNLWQHLVETSHQLATISGMLMLASFGTTFYVAIAVPARSLTDLVLLDAMLVFNHTGRWIFPKWFSAKYGGQNGAPATSPVAKP